MHRFLQQNIAPIPAQDVEMGIGNVVEPSTHATSHHHPALSPILPQSGEMVLDIMNTPEIVVFMER